MIKELTIKMLENNKKGSIEILKNIYYNDSDFSGSVENYLIENEMFYIEELLDTLAGIKDYSISFYNRNYISILEDVRSLTSFIDSCIKLNENYGTFKDKDANLLKVLENKLNTLYFMSYDNLMSYDNPNYDLLYDWILNKAIFIKNKLLSYFNSITDINNYSIEEFLNEVYYDSMLIYLDSNSFYYDDEKYILIDESEVE